MSTPQPPERPRYSNGDTFRRQAPVPAYQPPPPPNPPRGPGFLSAMFGTVAGLAICAIIGGAIYYMVNRPHSAGDTVAATSGKTGDSPLANFTAWQSSTDEAQKTDDAPKADISWWTRTFSLPSSDAASGYLKAQGVAVSQIQPVHFEDAKDSTTITYAVDATVPAQLVRLSKASWAPADPDLKPFAPVLVLNDGLPAGQFWNTKDAAVVAEAGSKLDLVWKVKLDKASGVVNADRLPYESGVYTVEQETKLQAACANTIADLQARVQAINAQVAADTSAKLAQVPANPAKPGLIASNWNHGDGSGEPTKSAERIGGGTVAGAAGGAAFGAAAGDAGMGAGIGAGVGLLGGIIYDAVSKNNDNARYKRHAAAVNEERMDDWRGQVKQLDKQRAQVKQDGAAEKQQLLNELASKIAAANGRLDTIPAPADIPPPAPAMSDAPKVDPPLETSAQPSGPIK